MSTFGSQEVISEDGDMLASSRGNSEANLRTISKLHECSSNIQKYGKTRDWYEPKVKYTI